VVDVIRDQGEESLMHMAGLDHTEDMFAPVHTLASHRALWLGVNLVIALLANWVIECSKRPFRQRLRLLR